MALADTARLIASLELDPRKFTKGLQTSEKALGKFESRAHRTGQQIGLGIRNIVTIGAATAAGIGSVAVASLKLAGDFEAQLNTINTIARTTPENLDAIGDSIRSIAKSTGTPLEDLTQGYYDLLSAGVDVADAQKVLASANTLAIGGLGTTAEAVDLLTTALNTYGYESERAGSVADVFAKAIERGKVTASELAEAFSTVGPIAASSGISIKEVSAGFARLTASGVPATAAATQMRAAINELAKPGGPLKKLEKQTGKSYKAIASKQGLVAALEQMRKDADKAGIPMTDLFGRVEGLNFALATTGPNFDDYNEDLGAMGDAAGTAASQMSERQKGLNFEIAKLKGLAKDAAITIGSELLPKITPLFTKLNTFLTSDEAQGAVSRFADQLGELFSEENVKAGIDALKEGFTIAKEAAPAIADAAKITGAAMKTAVDLFKSLPPEIQKIAIAGLAINKITGGLVTGLAGGLVSAVVKQVLGGFTGAMNVTAGVVNVTGGGGIPGAPGGPGGKPGGKPGLPGGLAVPAIGAGIIFDPTTLVPLKNEFIRQGRLNRESTDKIPPAVKEGDEKAFIRAKQAEDANRRRAMEIHRQNERLVLTGKEQKAAIDASKARLAAEAANTRRETTRGLTQTAASARNAGERARQAAFATRDAVVNKDLSVKVNVVNNLRLTVRDTQKKLTFQQNAAIYG